MAGVAFTDANFEEEVLKSQTPVLIDFWAEWCAPCRAVSPIIEELAGEYAGKIKVGKMNTDENSRTPQEFGVMSIPTVFIFKDGKPVKTIVGAQGKENYKKAIEEAIGN